MVQKIQFEYLYKHIIIFWGIALNKYIAIVLWPSLAQFRFLYFLAGQFKSVNICRKLGQIILILQKKKFKEMCDGWHETPPIPDIQLYGVICKSLKVEWVYWPSEKKILLFFQSGLNSEKSPINEGCIRLISFIKKSLVHHGLTTRNVILCSLIFGM